MKASYYTRIRETKKIEAGSILVAQPFWNEEMYQHVVVLVIEHTSKGTTGILLNRKSNLLVSEAIPALDAMKTLYYGGAFQTKIISYLHKNMNIPDSIYLGNGIFWGGNFDVISERINNQQIKDVDINFYAGFTSWSAGQLEVEVLNSKWWVCELNADELFSISCDELWEESLEHCGHTYAMFKNIPDPSFN